MNDKIINLIKSRLEIGMKEYGHEVDVHDGRNWMQETLEEMLDGMVYISAEILKIQENRGGCKECELKHKLNGLMKKYSLEKMTEIMMKYEEKNI